MVDPMVFAAAVAAILLLALFAWAVGSLMHDVSVVDSFWSLFFLVGALVYAAQAGSEGPRALLVIVLVTVWAMRLAIYLTWRNWGEPEDHRYQAIRARNQPGFVWKSLYLVFGLQGVLAAIIALPLLAGLGEPGTLTLLDLLGFAVWLAGIGFESISDWQLAKFKANPANRGRVLDTGLWRYTRHPNYFGEAVLWWGFYLIAIAAGGWWTVFAPLLITILLLKVSGVALLEKDICERRPAYREYVARTNAFIPGRPKEVA